MGKYVYIYVGGNDEDGGTAEEWGAWLNGLGDKLIDFGNPFDGTGTAVYNGGETMAIEDKPATGYSIVKADSMQEATEMAKGCPMMKSKDSVVCVYEALPM